MIVYGFGRFYSMVKMVGVSRAGLSERFYRVCNSATGVAVQDILPIGYSNITNISDGGSLSGNVIDWTGLTVTTTGLTLTYEATVNMPTLEDGEYINVAQVTASDQFDPNSDPDNDDGDQSEDDEDSAFIETFLSVPPINK